MLNILLGVSNKPKDNYIHDAEKFIYKVGILDNEISRVILEEIEEAEYLNASDYIDRYGYKLPITLLSTGSKILLEVANSNYIINGLELGQNAFDLLIECVDGSIYFDEVDRFELPDNFDLSRISVNGVVYNTLLDLENALWKE